MPECHLATKKKAVSLPLDTVQTHDDPVKNRAFKNVRQLIFYELN